MCGCARYVNFRKGQGKAATLPEFAKYQTSKISGKKLIYHQARAGTEFEMDHYGRGGRVTDAVKRGK